VGRPSHELAAPPARRLAGATALRVGARGARDESEARLPRLRVVLRGADGLLALQLAGMVLVNLLEYRRYSLTNDFAGYAQAWSAIGHGSLDPYLTVFRVRFLHNNLDLALYPLALVGRVVADPNLLSWAQDAAVVATELVALRWARDIVLERLAHRPRRADAIVAGLALVFAVNPFAWETAAFPVHFEAFAALFALAAGRDLWRARHGWVAVWVPLAMAAEALGSLYVLVAGAGALLAGRRTRHGGAVVAAVGAAGLACVLRLGLVGRGGQTLRSIYGYLLPSGQGHVGLGALLLGVATHLPAAAALLGRHLPFLLACVVAAGIAGAASPWGAAALVLVLVPNALSSQPGFVDLAGAFQSWPAQPFLAVGSASLAAAFLARERHEVARTACALALCSVVALGAVASAAVPGAWLFSRRTAATLAAVDRRLSERAEVIADQGLVGRFWRRAHVYSFIRAGQRFPVTGRLVVFLLFPGASAGERDIGRRLERSLRAVVVARGAGVLALAWHVPPGVGSVELAGGRAPARPRPGKAESRRRAGRRARTTPGRRPRRARISG